MVYFYNFSYLNQFAKNAFIVERKNKNVEQIFSYELVINISKALLRNFKQLEIPQGCKIAIQFPHSLSICSAILCILNHRCSFCPIRNDANCEDTADTLSRYGATFLLSEKKLNIFGWKILLEFYIFGMKIIFYAAEKLNDSGIAVNDNLCYSISTSGTTGKSKIVNVTFECIYPNISNLSNILTLTQKDVILFSSPPTFDPFVVELFLALHAGCSLLKTVSFGRISEEEYVNILFAEKSLFGVTLIQTTPSVFSYIDKEIIKHISGNTSNSLRALLLGGEPFPQQKIIQWRQMLLTSKCNIYNIYGITEVSCWSTIAKVTFDKETSLGNKIDKSTVLVVRNDHNELVTHGVGELYIGSSKRICYLDNETAEDFLNKIVYRPTGDIVEIINSNIFYRGRSNEIVKRFGHRLDIKHVESRIISSDLVKQASLVFVHETNCLVFFLVPKEESPLENNISKFILKNLKIHEKPDCVLYLKQIPLTNHGKISKKTLIEHYKRHLKNGPLTILTNFVETIFGFSLPNTFTMEYGVVSKKPKTFLESSFISLGGTSIQALSLVTEIEKMCKISQPKLLELLLNDTTTICEIIKILNDTPAATILNLNWNDSTFTRSKINVVWTVNLGKCVDATPTSYQIRDQKSIISVGCHSHKIMNVSAEDGSILSSLELADRIEGQVSIASENNAVVGCYDGYLYQFCVQTGHISWKYDTGEMIKCKPLITKGNGVCIGNYSLENNTFFFDLSENKLKWFRKIGKKGIFSSPVEFCPGKILLCSLDGTCELVDAYTGQCIWSKVLCSPIFSTCKVLNGQSFLVAEVNGIVRCINNSGKEIWSFSTGGNIFSSFEVTETIKGQTLVIFGCHDGFLYCLQAKESTADLYWKTDLKGQIYATPKIMRVPPFGIITATTKGDVYVLDLQSGAIRGSITLGGQIFSSPCLLDDMCFIGCRDNNLYGLSIKI